MFTAYFPDSTGAQFEYMVILLVDELVKSDFRHKQLPGLYDRL